MIRYRPATIADGPELDAMALAIWIETFGHSAPPDDIAAYIGASYGPGGKLIRDLSDPTVTVQLACTDDHIIGYAKLTPPFVQPALAVDALQLNQLYIASDWHGHGIADALMRWTADTARDRGAKALVLTVWEENARARRFYEKRGFVHVGDYAFSTGTQIDRDLIMRLAL